MLFRQIICDLRPFRLRFCHLRLFGLLCYHPGKRKHFHAPDCCSSWFDSLCHNLRKRFCPLNGGYLPWLMKIFSVVGPNCGLQIPFHVDLEHSGFRIPSGHEYLFFAVPANRGLFRKSVAGLNPNPAD